jgi:hypothetical protein
VFLQLHFTERKLAWNYSTFSTGHGVSEKVAREICKDWNAEHGPGLLSDKAEYESA